MATEAERLLSASGWLPEPLRMDALDDIADAADAGGAEAETLPDFLTDDSEDEEPAEDEEQDPAHRIAAE
ncbi:hypothetical protein, partial [Haematobacter missouriensis]|uniref:hypothetical protein n=1 Tax=Haematobacter missouriensis TaxID=366616 RepID=UPI0023F2B906